MNRKETIDQILSVYQVVKLLADRNGCQTIQIRHKKNGNDLVLHSFPHTNEIYELLCETECSFLPKVFDAINCEDGLIVLEEFVQGNCLADSLEDRLFTFKQAKKILNSLCCALMALHGCGFVHRDIKPENIILRDNGSCVLIDFNAARKIRSTAKAKGAEKDTKILGTVGYAAPEQMGISQSDFRTDIYAMGILLNVIMTGEHPSKKMVRGKARRIVRKCTLVNPEERYQSANELWKAL